MFTRQIRAITLTLALAVLGGSILHAATPASSSDNTSTLSSAGPTGGDPEPTGPGAISIMVMILQTGIE